MSKFTKLGSQGSGQVGYLASSHLTICHSRWLFVKINNLLCTLLMLGRKVGENGHMKILCNFHLALQKRVKIKLKVLG